MHIVIALPDETYKAIKEEKGIYDMEDGLSSRIAGKVVGAIQAGTPLREMWIQESQTHNVSDEKERMNEADN